MEKKNFDLALVKKINLLIQKNVNTDSLLIQKNVNNDSPFEWFVVGFLYAHPHNVQTLDKIFADVHTVISLNKTNHFLTPDDTNEILVKMINNLISSQVTFFWLINSSKFFLNRQMEISIKTQKSRYLQTTKSKKQ